jgi:NADPH-dependent 2,4-dienoyl-CoA reductase/sulfur reductase-like enzyme
VVACDLSARTITLADGSLVGFDALVAASGIRPRDFNIPGPRNGRHFLRAAADAQALREQLVPGARILILGSGFIGCEVAATARQLGCEVDIVTLDLVPMYRPLGTILGAGMQAHHEEHGVRFHFGRSITEFTGHDRVTGAVLDDDSSLEADVVLEAVGSVPNTQWLAGNNIDLSDGILTDSSLRVVGSPLPFVAVGDVARYENALFPGVARRIEHWNLPTDTGKRAGATLATLLAGGQPDQTPFAPMPSFWSDQYHCKVQSFGLPGIADEIVIVGAGAAGIAVASSLLSRDSKLDVVIIDPADTHYYQPGWTMVGGGIFKPETTVKKMASVIPSKVKWIKVAVAGFERPRRSSSLQRHRRGPHWKDRNDGCVN